jgi:hypothetical protein
MKIKIHNYPLLSYIASQESLGATVNEMRYDEQIIHLHAAFFNTLASFLGTYW